MARLIFVIFLAVASAQSYDPSEIFSKELSVPENPEEFIANYYKSGIIEQQRSPRIGHGMNATVGQFPYALRVTIFDRDGETFVCTGAIISDRFMLTVRHCFDPQLTYRVMAAAGAVDRFSPDMISRFSGRFVFAPPISGWNPDLAICEMSEPFPISSRILPIRLPSRSQVNYEFARYPIQIVGWGRNRHGDMTQILKWANFRIETNCWSNRRPQHLCSEPVAGWHVETRAGDSGGPWVVTEAGIPTLVGLTEGSSGSASVWWFRGLRVSQFLDFISSVSGIAIRP